MEKMRVKIGNDGKEFPPFWMGGGPGDFIVLCRDEQPIVELQTLRISAKQMAELMMSCSMCFVEKFNEEVARIQREFEEEQPHNNC